MTFPTKTCPLHHEVALVEVNRSGVSIDVCPECKGIWLDRGELESIIRMTRELEAEIAGPAPRQEAPRQDRYEEPLRGREYDGRRRDLDEDDDHYRGGRDRDDDDHYRKRRKGPLGKLLDIFD